MAYKVFAQDIAAPLSHLVYYSLAGLDKRTEKLIGAKSKSPLQEAIKTNVRWGLEEKNVLAQEKRILKKLENPRFYKLLIKKSYDSLEEFRRAAPWIKSKNFSNFSSKKITQLLKRYLRIWVEATIWGNIVNLSDFRFGLLSDKVMNLVKKKTEMVKTKNSLVEIFVILTTPSKRSLVMEQDLNLFRLLKTIQENKKLQNLFLKPEDLETLEKNLKKLSFWQKIKKHASKYDWLQYHYIGPTILNEVYFIDLLRGLVKQKLDALKKIEEIIQKEKNTIKKQKELKKKLDFNEKELYWIKMAQEFIYLKGLRKEITFIASRSYDILLKEIAKRFNLSLRQLQFMTPREVFDGLAGKKRPSPDLLNQRINYCVLYYPKGEPRVYIGKRAKKLADKLQEEKIEKETKELKGAIAFSGKAKGRVVIIFEAKDILKMEGGGILVSPATNPNLMPAIKKASAIITDEGGITCHAAIVSRELNIPCIIGTKIATKVLRDGDFVEVDANKGIVKIINKVKQ